MCAAANSSGAADRSGRYPEILVPNRDEMLQRFAENEDRIMKNLMEGRFHPDKCFDYKLADLKLRCEKLFEEIFQFFDQERNFEPVEIFQATDRLHKVCEGFMKIINENINLDPDLRNFLRGASMLQASPIRPEFNDEPEERMNEFFQNISPI